MDRKHDGGPLIVIMKDFAADVRRHYHWLLLFIIIGLLPFNDRDNVRERERRRF